MTADVPPLVELGHVPLIYCSGLAYAEVIETEGHYYYFQLMRDGIGPDAPIIRAISLHLVVPVMASILGMQVSADVLGMVPIRARPRRMDG